MNANPQWLAEENGGDPAHLHANNTRVVCRENLALVTCGKSCYELSRWNNLVRDLGEIDYPVVVDLERVTGLLSEIDAYLLALEFEQQPRRQSHRTAIVATGSTRAGLEFLAASSRIRGLDIQIFETIEKAVLWARG